jgi:hypothetical protein
MPSTAWDGGACRNTEIVTVSGGQIVDVEVYFGWDLRHKARRGSFLEDDDTLAAPREGR